MPLSNFVPRGFGFVHHSIAILYHEVPNPNLTIRNFCIAVPWWGFGHSHTRVGGRRVLPRLVRALVRLMHGAADGQAVRADELAAALTCAALVFHLGEAHRELAG